MQLRQIVKDDDAVSPVIGVILMVAITVILAAVIATFVLGLGSDLTNTTPRTSVSFDYAAGENTGATADGDGKLTITHSAGESIQADKIFILGSEEDGDFSSAGSSSYSSTQLVSAGHSISVDVKSGATVKVVYRDDSSGSSATLDTWEGPDA